MEAHHTDQGNADVSYIALLFVRVTVSIDDYMHGTVSNVHSYVKESLWLRLIPPLTPSGRPLVLVVGPVPLVVVATADPLRQGAKVTPAAPVTVHHLDEDADAPTPGRIRGPDQGPIPIPDAIRGTLDLGAVPTLLMVERSMAEVGTEADLQCLTGGDTREIE